MKRRWLRRILVLSALLIAGCVMTRTPVPSLADGVTKEVQLLQLKGQHVSVTMYYPAQRTEAPIVVVAHGFTRSKRYMAGWGALLAKEGFTAAVLTQPHVAAHDANGAVIAELVEQMHSGKVSLKVKPSGAVALMGHSMGGLTTLLAAGKRPVTAWVGLDPVGMNDSWLAVGRHLTIPCLILRAEPGAWNKNGNARQLFPVLAGSKMSMKVRGSTHLDCESPTDILGQLACGRSEQKRREVFEKYVVAFLKFALRHDEAAKAVLDGATRDPALTEVENQLRGGASIGKLNPTH